MRDIDVSKEELSWSPTSLSPPGLHYPVARHNQDDLGSPECNWITREAVCGQALATSHNCVLNIATISV